MEKGNPGRNLERDFTELCASSYEYCYDNPIVYDDPNGEQPPMKKRVVPAFVAPPVFFPQELTKNLPKGGELRPFFVVFHKDRCCSDVCDSGPTTTTCKADKIKLNGQTLVQSLAV
jgi:hypothetical protein